MSGLALRIRLAFLCASVGLGLSASLLAAQDEVWEHQQHIQAQQEEQRRLNDLAAEQNEAYLAAEADREDYEREAAGREAGGSARDPMDLQMDAMAGSVLAAHSAASAEIERMKRDPKLGPIIRGNWEFFQGVANARAGEFCTALYTNIAGFVHLSGPGGSYRGALLTFWGRDIPRPDKAGLVLVTLIQVDDNDPSTTSTQTVRAYNHKDDKVRGLGALTFAVPTVDALIDNIHDHQDFKLEIGGQEVLSMGFHSGIMARERLRKCVSAE